MKIKKEFIIKESDCNNIVSESFGINGGYTNKICDIEIPDDYKILYITGESGSGKSVILNEIIKNYKSEEIPIDKPLYLWGGDSEEKQINTMKMLSLVGLSDALMFVNRYENLSDSQKARARIYLELNSNKDIIVIDEFLSTLDRKTAKAVAYVIQKAFRKSNKKLIVATAHNDLEDYLKPDYIIIGKSFPSQFEIFNRYVNLKNPFKEEVVLFYGDKREYKKLKLGELHYKGKYTGGTKEYLFAKIHDEIIGVLVSTYNMHTNGRRISRLVVHPSYRSCGIGQMLVEKYIHDFDNVDVIATMGLFNPVFEKAGMKRIEDSIVKPPKGLEEILQVNNFDLKKWHDYNYCIDWCKSFEHRLIISRFSKNATKLVQPGGEHLKVESIEEKILVSQQTAGRVLNQLRKRRMAKLKSNIV